MKKRFSNNKGFSLVELIIVVAIMAILIGILAPQYMKYVEKSRISADNDSVDSIRKTIETVASDPNVTLSQSQYTVTVGSGGVSINPASSDLETEVKKLLDISNIKLKSKTYKSNDVTIVLEFKTENGVDLPTITVSGVKGNS